MAYTYKLPSEIEPYREFISNTGGNDVEDLMDRLNNDKHISQTNIVVFVMAISVEAQIGLLQTLAKKGLLCAKQS